MGGFIIYVLVLRVHVHAFLLNVVFRLGNFKSTDRRSRDNDFPGLDARLEVSHGGGDGGGGGGGLAVPLFRRRRRRRAPRGVRSEAEGEAGGQEEEGEARVVPEGGEIPSIVSIQGDRAPHGLAFVDTFVKCSNGWRSVTAAAPLPSRMIGTSYYDVNNI